MRVCLCAFVCACDYVGAFLCVCLYACACVRVRVRALRVYVARISMFPVSTLVHWSVSCTDCDHGWSGSISAARGGGREWPSNPGWAGGELGRKAFLNSHCETPPTPAQSSPPQSQSRPPSGPPPQVSRHGLQLQPLPIISKFTAAVYSCNPCRQSSAAAVSD